MVAKEHLQTPKLSHKNLPRKPWPEIHTIVRPTPNQHLEFRANLLLYGLLSTIVLQQQIPSSCLIFHASLASKTVPTSLLYGSIQYGLPHNNIFRQLLNKILLGICAQFLFKTVPNRLPTISSKLFLKSLFVRLAHYPRLSLITKNDFSPSPSLNPMAKI
jgi:hypothetical protein